MRRRTRWSISSAAASKEMFSPTRKAVYSEVLPLPKMEEVAERVRRNRILIIVSPDAKIPPEEVERFFNELSQRTICVYSLVTKRRWLASKRPPANSTPPKKQTIVSHTAIPNGLIWKRNSKLMNLISPLPSSTSLTRCFFPFNARANRPN